MAFSTNPEDDDPFFGAAWIDADEWRDDPVRHRYIHGGFEGTDTRFSFYFPPPEVYEGRFIQPLEGGPGGHENTLNGSMRGIYGGLSWAVRLGAYAVESNQGHFGMELCQKAGDDLSVYGWRAS